MVRLSLVAGVAVTCVAFLAAVRGAEPGAAERGRRALETRAFNPAQWALKSYDNAWKFWDDKGEAPPANYAEAFREHYGLHPAPFDNGKYPMGLREAPAALLGKGLASDCLLCHGGSILGKSYVGLGNASLDIQAVFEDLDKAGGGRGKLPFTFSNVRGTSEAVGFAVFLLQYREPDLTLRLTNPYALKVRDDLCEDVPAWWHLRKKQTMYATGTTDSHSVRSLMQFMLVPGNGRAVFDREEATFRDIQAYLFSLRAPKYPYPIDRPLARKGEAIFAANCARCHGTYGEQWTYPNRIVPLDEIGTDRTRHEGLNDSWGEHYNRSWFAREETGWLGRGYRAKRTAGYQAPPLDGVWATAPYFHNGSVPTVYHVLNSKARPKVFTRSYRTDAAAYDPVRLGWKVQVLEGGADPRLTPYERRKVYDTTQPGRGNGGHTFGDDLGDDERRALIEYLKAL